MTKLAFTPQHIGHCLQPYLLKSDFMVLGKYIDYCLFIKNSV